jgi:hypothetical protein
MRSNTLVFGVVVSATLTLGTPSWAQPAKDDSKKPAESSLEDMLAKALKQNPDILIAKAKVLVVQAELHQVQQRIQAKIVATVGEIEAATAVFKEAKARLDRLDVLRKAGQIALEEYSAAVLTHDRYLAELKKKEAELPFLVGTKLPSKDGKLPAVEEMLAMALKHHSDILVAEAKANMVDAELNKVRQDVLGKITALVADIDASVATYKEWQARLERLALMKSGKIVGLVSLEEYSAALLTRDKYFLELAKKKAELPVLIGKKVAAGSSGVHSIAFSPDGKLLYTIELDGALRIWDQTGKQIIAPNVDIKGSEADKLRKALDTPVKAQFKKTPLKDVLQYLQDMAKVNIIWAAKSVDVSTPFSAEVSDIPLGALVQLLEDLKGVQFVVREYGILVLDRDNSVPGGVHLYEFWKRQVSEQSKPKVP